MSKFLISVILMCAATAANASTYTFTTLGGSTLYTPAESVGGKAVFDITVAENIFDITAAIILTENESLSCGPRGRLGKVHNPGVGGVFPLVGGLNVVGRVRRRGSKGDRKSSGHVVNSSGSPG